MPDPGPQTDQPPATDFVDQELATRLERRALIALYYHDVGDSRKATVASGRLYEEIERHRLRTGRSLQVSFTDDVKIPNARQVAEWERDDPIAHWEKRLEAKRARRRAARAAGLVRDARAEARVNGGKAPDFALAGCRSLSELRRYASEASRAAYVREGELSVTAGVLQGSRPREGCRRSNARARGSRRSSSGGGDPGDGGGDSDPPGLAAAEEGQPEQGRLCLCGCGTSLLGRKADAEFVNDTHSKRFRRREKKRVEEWHPTAGAPDQSDVFADLLDVYALETSGRAWSGRRRHIGAVVA